MLFLRRREIYLLEKLLFHLKKGLESEPVLREMEEEAKKKREREEGREVAKRAYFRGLVVFFILLILMGLFSEKKPVSFSFNAGAAAQQGAGKEKIIISYYFDADYIELTGFNWKNYLYNDRKVEELKKIALYIFLGGKDYKTVENRIRRILSSSQNPLLKGRLFLALSRLYYLQGQRTKALFYARRSLELVRSVPALCYDPLTSVLEILWKENRTGDMYPYIPFALELLSRDFYYPLFKFTALYILQREGEENYRTRWAILTLRAILHNFPTNLKLANDFTSDLKKCSTPLCSLCLGMVYSSIGFREGSRKYLKDFIKAARANPSKYGGLLPLAMEYLNAD